MLTENGLMLGLFPHAIYSIYQAVVQPGDRFLLYTDGLVEAANSNGDFVGADRTKQRYSSPLRSSPRPPWSQHSSVKLPLGP